MLNNNSTIESDVLVIGSGMGSLSTACLLAKDGLKVTVLEQNYLPGGCTSSYWRKGFVFEAGATTLVGLGKGMPLQHLCDTLEIDLKPIQLDLPMKVRLSDGTWIHKYQDLEQWIAEAERVFGQKGQREFWTFCNDIADFVWRTSLRQRRFPPGKLSDLWSAVANSNLEQFQKAWWSLRTMKDVLRKFDLHEHTQFIQYLNEQLLITAQNHIDEVNVLFGCTAVCYTQSPNFYMPGGLLELVNPFVKYLENHGGKLLLRHSVTSIESQNKHYTVHTAKHGSFKAPLLVSGLPVNNLVEMGNWPQLKALKKKLLPSEHLNSAFQMGIAYRNTNAKIKSEDCIHYQLHLDRPIAGLQSASLFVSLSHPEDPSRSDNPGHTVASVSTHVQDPATRMSWDKSDTEQAILEFLSELGFFKQEDVVYFHSSTPAGWQKWTGRKWGFVGGYPQLRHIKPWQMIESRLDGEGAYLVGDTVYPGQGIPGVTLGGIIAYEKIKADKPNFFL